MKEEVKMTNLAIRFICSCLKKRLVIKMHRIALELIEYTARSASITKRTANLKKRVSFGVRHLHLIPKLELPDGWKILKENCSKTLIANDPLNGSLVTC